jgi:methylated-DNA-[protein]-cysteine S-methyltransferase
MATQYAIIATDWGYTGLAANEHGICRTVLPLPKPGDVETSLLAETPDAVMCQHVNHTLELQMQDYFSGRDSTFDNTVRLDLGWARPFTLAVLQACRHIPSGETRTYGQLARAAGHPQAARAVGGVMAKNPLPLLIPCHRVLGATGRLTGFSAPGGLEMKQRMLDLERTASAD